MKGLVYINVFLLVLFANSIESRHEPGDHHWKKLMDKMDDCTETLKLEDGKLFVESRPQDQFYSDDTKTKLFVADIERQLARFYRDVSKRKLAKDIEPRPNSSFYPDSTKTKLSVEDVEPRPNLSFYPDDDTKTKLFVEEIGPRPNLTFYPDDIKTKLEDVEPRPNVSFYPNDDTKTKLFVEEIEPRPNVTFYPDNLKAKEVSAHGEGNIQVEQA